MSKLFSPFTLRKIKFKNRIFVSPMCQYSSPDGMPTDSRGRLAESRNAGKQTFYPVLWG
jgi:2,4-dienoyl-CoA reductase-like NADH-dependent reductase (Old Yellow Enzyme family)